MVSGSLEKNIGEAAALLAALGNENRLLILQSLMSGDKSSSTLSRELGISTASMFQQLRVLTDCKLIQRRRRPGVYTICIEAMKMMLLLEALFGARKPAV